MNRYSLTDYVLSVKVPEELREVFSDEDIDYSSNIISIGGDGSYVGSITLHRNSNQWTTEGDHTGSWVHNKNKDKTGTLTVSITQISDKVKMLVRLYETYYSSDTVTEGLTITVTKATGNGNQEDVATCTDCYIQAIPDIAFGESAADQSWVFTCGKIDFRA